MELMELIEAVQEREKQSGYASLAAQGKVVSDVSALEAEVNNGGFHQYFFNSAGDHTAAALHGLEQIGALAAAALVKEACRLFPEGQPHSDRSQRQLQLDTISESAFDGIDRRFFAYPDPIGDLLLAYAKKSLGL
jgi:hypothetical protein